MLDGLVVFAAVLFTGAVLAALGLRLANERR